MTTFARLQPVSRALVFAVLALCGTPRQSLSQGDIAYLLIADARPVPRVSNGVSDLSAPSKVFAGFAWSKIGTYEAKGCESFSDVLKDPKLDHLGRIVACVAKPVPDSVDRTAFLAHSSMMRDAAAGIAAIVAKNAGKSTFRTTAVRGDEIKIVVLQSGLQVVRKDTDGKLDTRLGSASCPVALLARPIVVPVKTEERQSRISSDLKLLLQVGLAIAGAPGSKTGVTPVEGTAIPCATYTTLDTTVTDMVSVFGHLVSLHRSTMTVGVDASAAPTRVVTALSSKDRALVTKPVTATETKMPDMNTKLVTGPTERWFLSGDVPLKGTKADDYKFNPDNNQVELSTKPSSYHLSVNFLLGDLLTSDRGFLSNFFLKGSVAASNKPLDSYGIGFGYAGALFPKKWGVSFEALSPYVAHIWTKADQANLVTGSISEGATTKGEWRWGAGVNLGKVLSWVKE